MTAALRKLKLQRQQMLQRAEIDKQVQALLENKLNVYKIKEGKQEEIEHILHYLSLPL